MEKDDNLPAQRTSWDRAKPVHLLHAEVPGIAHVLSNSDMFPMVPMMPRGRAALGNLKSASQFSRRFAGRLPEVFADASPK